MTKLAHSMQFAKCFVFFPRTFFGSEGSGTPWLLWAVFMLARLRVCLGAFRGNFTSCSGHKSKPRDPFRVRGGIPLGRTGLVHLVPRQSLRSGGAASTLECAAVSSRRRLAANDLSAAEVSMADQRETKAAERRRAGTDRARAVAKSRRNRADSWLNRPPTSMPRTTSWQRWDWTSSG